MKPNFPNQPGFTSRRLEQQWIRTQAVKMAGVGYSVSEVAAFFSVTTRAVFKWLATFAESGHNGLEAKKGAGRPAKVNLEQMQWIAFMVRHTTPNQLGFDSGLWTLRLIGQLIERQFAMKLSLPT